MPAADYVLVDVSNSFTKIVFSSREKLGRQVHRIPTRDLSPATLAPLLKGKKPRHAVVASVVPDSNAVLSATLPAPICWVKAGTPLGVGIDYPRPETIGADRLANAAAVLALYGAPAIVVDFGTAVTFDVVSARGDYIGGVIAPGLNAMTDYLHDRTALLPRIRVSEPRSAIGRSTEEAMRVGAVHGYRGLIREIILQIKKEISPRRSPVIVATGGDAKLIAGQTQIFSAVAPTLTLEGLRLIGNLNF